MAKVPGQVIRSNSGWHFFASKKLYSVINLKQYVSFDKFPFLISPVYILKLVDYASADLEDCPTQLTLIFIF